jgi:hypothetical protein
VVVLVRLALHLQLEALVMVVLVYHLVLLAHRFSMLVGVEVVVE